MTVNVWRPDLPVTLRINCRRLIRGNYLVKIMSKKPSIDWMEGLLVLFNATFPYECNHPHYRGFSVGRQIIGLYIIEMLLKYALDDSGASHGAHHNLHELFRQLSSDNRRAVEQKYTEILNSELDWTWDIAETVDSFLQYFGRNAITDTRYFWEPDRTHHEYAASLFVPEILHPLIGALLIVLHNYPYPSELIVKQYDTIFKPLPEYLKQNQRRMQ